MKIATYGIFRMKTYKLVWIVGGKVREELFRNNTYSLCKWKANQLKATTHRGGKLLILPNDLKITKLNYDGGLGT